MLPFYTVEIARDEVADTWSQLARIRHEDLTEATQATVAVLELEGRHLTSFIRSCSWRYEQLNEDLQALIDAAVEEDYRYLIEDSLK